MPKVSRREFLKFMAAGGVAAAAGFAGLSSFTPKSSKHVALAQAGPEDWVDGSDTIGHAVHVALLPNGKVFYVGGSGWHIGQWKKSTFQAGIYDPVSDTHQELTHPVGEDLFCCGHVPLEDGNILLAGGTLEYRSLSPNKRYWGLNAAYEFDWENESFTKRQSMAHGRWYPTMVTLEDGRILTVAGYDEFGYHNLLTEVYDPETPGWSISYDPNTSRTYRVGCDSNGCAEATDGTPIEGAGEQEYGDTNMGVAPTGIGLYPRMHLMPNGIVAMVGQGGTRRTWEPSTGKWRGAGSATKRSYGTSVLLPLQNLLSEKGEILVCGGSSNSAQDATNSAEIITPTANGLSLQSTSIDPMTYPRRQCNPVILPTGKIIIFGGNEQKNVSETAVYVPEQFDPETETWTELPAHEVPRIYHSGAILLQDGRVWTMGTSYNANNYERRTETYRPPYYFATRPVITDSPDVGNYGGNITLETPDAASIVKVSLLKVSSTTHHYNTDQRLIWLQIDEDSRTGSSLTVSAPINSRLAPSGYYMIHVINDEDVPSEGRMIQIKAAPFNPVFYDVESPGDHYTTLQGTGDIRAGVEALPGSALIGKTLKRWTVYLRRVAAPTGDVVARIRNKSDDSVIITESQAIAASSLTASPSYLAYEFVFDTPRTIQANDRILIEYDGPNGVRMDAWNVQKFDGTKTRRTKYSSSTGLYSGSFMNEKDTSGIMSSE
jgi:hypothetical protein